MGKQSKHKAISDQLANLMSCCVYQEACFTSQNVFFSSEASVAHISTWHHAVPDYTLIVAELIPTDTDTM